MRNMFCALMYKKYKTFQISLIIIEIPINIIVFDVMLGYLSAKLNYLK